MSSKKGGKRKRVHAAKPDDNSTEHVVFGLMSEMFARGIEKGAYRWCLRKNADPRRTVIVVFVPSDMPDGVIRSVMARALNRGMVRIVDSTKADTNYYQSILVEAEGVIGINSCPTLISCDDCPLRYWIMVAPVEDNDIEPIGSMEAILEKEPSPAKGLLASKDTPSTKRSQAAKDDLPAKGTQATKDDLPVKGLLTTKEDPPSKGPQAAKNTGAAKSSQVALPAKGTQATKDSLPLKRHPVSKGASHVKENLSTKDSPPAKGTSAKDASHTKGTSATKNAPPTAKDTTATKDTLSTAKGTTATKDTLSTAKDTTATKDTLSTAKGTTATKDTLSTAKGTTATKDTLSTAKGTTATKDTLSTAKGTTATKDTLSTAKGTTATKYSTHANKNAPPYNVPPSTKDNLSEKGLQSAKGSPLKVISAKDSPLGKGCPQSKDFPPAKGILPAIEPSHAKDLPVKRNIEDVKTPHMLLNGESFGRVLIEPKSILNFGNHDRPEIPIMNLPEVSIKARYDVWGGFSMERQIRREDIEKGLQFIQSTIPFHGTEDDYKHFLQKLVEDLFTEGNDLYREGEVKLALGQYTEGLTVAEYAASEEFVLSQELLCRLFVNRSCCYFSMGLFEKSLEDSEKALSLDKENMRALYRKAKALHQLGKHQEAYGCISHRILALVQDESVTELAQELVQKLGLKQRRAYKRPQQELEKFGLITNGVSAGCKTSNGIGSLDDIYTDVPLNSSVFPFSKSDSLVTAACPPSLATATNNGNDFNDCDVIGDELDSFLESEMASKPVPQLIPVFPTGNPLISSMGTTGLPALSPLPPASFGGLDSRKHPIVPLKSTFAHRVDALDSFETMRETLDSLDTFVNDAKFAEPLLVKVNQKQKPTVNIVNHLFAHKTDPVQTHISALPPLLPNPLAQTYDFKQGCQLCNVRTGPKALDFTYKEKLDHKCKKDILLARMKNSENKAWLKIRIRPMKVNFTGPYMLCKDIQSKQDCKFGDNCTFAYYQEEIDVWNEERKGALHRDQLFQPPGLVKPGSVSRLLHEQKGIFTFLCQACFDSKPQIISKRNPENPDVCSNPSNQHSFSDHKCLVHVLNSSTVRYCKIRPNHPRLQMDMCRHEVRYGCHQEDSCNFAHNDVELCVWMLQRQSGVTLEEIVLESERMWKVAEPKSKPPPKPLDMKMKFVCGQCLRNGREIEADRDGKYCTAKARHSWTKDKRVLLMMSKAKKKWVPIRPLPSIRSFPQQYELGVQ
ncbi:zinc finger CCCH domain-containing protein 7B isoform X2 [Rhinoderma darwinii]|uniref:zinc finger CCCH domain-containing protein 7B isoform X2 n=1 Tax=Rhinoderma darwinii TaxID=43563 RepID=UPI003F678E00